MSEQKPPQDLALGEPIAIVGIGCMFPQAPDLDSYWRNIKSSRDAISGIPASHWDPDDYFDPDPNAPDMTYARRGGFLDAVDFNPLHYGISPNTIEAIDSTHLLTLVAAEQALANAGYCVRENSKTGRAFDRSRTSVMLGVTGTLELVIPLGARLGHPKWRKAMLDAGIPADTTEEIITRISAGYVPWQEQSFPGLLGNVTAGRIANRLDLGGSNCVVDAACASSISAIHMAVMELSLGRCDMAISGGVDTFNDIFMYMCFSKTPALSASGDARPFSASADGTMLGEGVGLIVLKRLSDAQRDGDTIQAIIKGIGASSDGAGNAIYAPSSDGQSRALRAAYREAGVRPRTIELVEAHGTGTRVGDQVEANSLSAVFSEDPAPCESADSTSAAVQHSWCALGSVKSMIGHTKAAAGVAGLIKTVLALQHKVLPPTLKIDQPLDSLTPGRSPIYLNTNARPWISKSAHPRRAAVSAFGFGGSNFHCVLEESEVNKSTADWSGDLQLLAFSAEQHVDVLNKIANFQEIIDNESDASSDQHWNEIRRFAKQSRDSFSATDACRFVFVLHREQLDDKALSGRIKNLAQLNPQPDPQLRGFYGQGAAKGRLGLVFPGQGSQRTNMLLDLSCQFPAMLERWQQVNDSVVNESDSQLISERVYPIPVFDSETLRNQHQALRATRVAQPALAAASLGILDVLSSFGVNADAYAGHSFGEFIALYAAGAISDNTLFELASQRGEAMEMACQATQGSMLALSAQRDDVESLLKTHSLDLSIANHNSPTQVVLSGAIEVLNKASDLFKAQGLHPVTLNVAGAFHSPLMHSARQQFASDLDTAEIKSPRQTVYSNVSAAQYPFNGDEITQLLSSQITAPVRFVEMIQAMYSEGIQTFVEVGPGKVLQTLITNILKDQPHHVIAVDAGCGQGPELADLGSALAQLAAGGYEIDLQQWDPTPPAEIKPDAFSIPISGANHFQPQELPQMQHPLNASKIQIPQTPQATPAVRTLESTIAPTLAPRVKVAPELDPAYPSTTSAAATSGTNSGHNMDFIQSTLLALQKMQQQTSDLHRQYLENQQAAQRSIELLIRQQLQPGGIESSVAESFPLTPSVPATGVISEIPSPEKSPEPTPAPAQHKIAATTVPDPLPVPAPAHATPVVMESLLKIVAEKTGYPQEVLTPEMSLDSDLGIDSIKRVEIFSALAEQFPILAGLSPDEAGSLDSLQQIEAHLNAVSEPSSNSNIQPTAPEAQTVQDSVPGNADTWIGNGTEILSAIIEVIAEKTGYPSEALNPDMLLDDDLGIDSIKRVEILSALQDKYPDLPSPEADSVATLQSIADIGVLLGSNSTPAVPSVADANTDIVEPTAVMAQIDNAGDAGLQIRQVIADKTGYPAEMLDLNMQLDSDLGIDSIKRVEIFSVLQEQFPNAPIVEPDAMASLQCIGDIIDQLDGPGSNSDHSKGSNGANVSNETKGSNGANGPALSCSKNEPQTPRNSSTMDLPQGPGNLEHNLHRMVLKSVSVDSSSREILQVPADAVIGIVDNGTDLGDSLGLAFEQRGIFSKLIPLDQQHIEESITGLVFLSPTHTSIDTLSQAFIQLRNYGPQLQRSAARGPALLACVSCLNGQFGLGSKTNAQPLSAGLGGMVKTAGREWPEVHCKCIDTSATRTSLKDQAEAIVKEILLLGPMEVGLDSKGPKTLELSAQQLPTSQSDNSIQLAPKDLVLVSGGARGISAAIAIALAEHYQPTLLLIGRSPEPQAEADWLTGLDEETAIKRAIHRHHGRAKSPKDIERTYQQILANREMQQTLKTIEANGSKVLYRSVDIRDQNALINTLASITDEHGPLRGIIHGAGVLADSLIVDKTEQQFDAVMSTKCQGFLNLVAALNHSPPAFIVACSSTTARLGRRGQADYAAANECLNKISQNLAREYPDTKVLSINWGPWDGGMVNGRLKTIFAREGVGLIPLQAGAEYLIRELLNTESQEVEVVILGPTPSHIPACSAHPVSDSLPEPSANPLTPLQVCFSQEVSLSSMPILAAHVINARAVVPVALIIEWLAHGALHSSPGLRFIGLEDFQVFKGITLDAAQSLDVRILAGAAERQHTAQGLQEIITMELRSHEQLHARAKIHLGEAYLSRNDQLPTTLLAPDSRQPYIDSQLFHGTELQGLTTITGCDEFGISGESNTAPPPADWIKHPLRTQWLCDPLVLDVSFQMMILWAEHTYSHCSLPTSIGRLEIYAPFPKTTVVIDAHLQSHHAHKANADINFRDNQGKLIARIEDYECVIDVSLSAGFARNTLDGHS